MPTKQGARRSVIGPAIGARLWPLCAGLLLLCAACGESARMASAPAEFPQVGLALPPAGGELKSDKPGRAPSPAPGDVPSPIPRKIIYTAEVELIVEDFARAETSLARLVAQNKGYMAKADVSGAPGRQRFGSWKVRVPIERFEAFLEAVTQLGELQRRQTNSQDVTEEYYDLDARIKNKKVEETRLIKHLEESTGKLKDILDVERELSRVREEAERMEGRLRLLQNLTALTTVDVVFHERESYVPPASPTFATSIARTFLGSFHLLVDVGKALVLILIALAPWLPVAVVLVFLLIVLLRRLRSRLAAAAAARRAPEARPAG